MDCANLQNNIKKKRANVLFKKGVNQDEPFPAGDFNEMIEMEPSCLWRKT